MLYKISFSPSFYFIDLFIYFLLLDYFHEGSSGLIQRIYDFKSHQAPVCLLCGSVNTF